ncbi:aldo/keto reductase [Mycena pura]|uniref:Aldo/keto reductase n=1 Tax=Mycena pura TaxID=153505 RepID=A0AAD6YL81_9AGAR|nr:aldo/keto reductase [Mycena pura]
MVHTTTKLGGTASDVTIARVAHGLMRMTWVPTPAPDEQCFEAIKAGIDALPPGTKMFLNSGEFYAMDWSTGNLEMLSRFFAKYPEYADKTFLSVKGAFRDRAPDNSPENIRASVENIQRALGPIKKIDLFQPARMDRKVPIEQSMQAMVALIGEGKFSHIGLSECNATTLRKAHAVHPVTAAEIEISPLAYDENQKNVIATAEELGISVLAYSPLGRGFLSGNIKSVSDLHELEALAKTKNITVAQLCIAWVAALSPNVIPLPGSSKSTRTLENLEAGDIVLDAEELKKMNEIIEKHGVKG